PQLAVEHLATQARGGALLLLPDPLADLVARPAGAHVREPVAAGSRAGGRDDLHRIGVAQLPRERRDPPVHPRALAVDADLGVYREGEVDRSRPLRELEDITRGREDEYLV